MSEGFFFLGDGVFGDLVWLYMFIKEFLFKMFNVGLLSLKFLWIVLGVVLGMVGRLDMLLWVFRYIFWRFLVFLLCLEIKLGIWLRVLILLDLDGRRILCFDVVFVFGNFWILIWWIIFCFLSNCLIWVFKIIIMLIVFLIVLFFFFSLWISLLFILFVLVFWSFNFFKFFFNIVCFFCWW